MEVDAERLIATEGLGLARKLFELCKDDSQRGGVISAGGHHVLVGLLHARLGDQAHEYAVEALLHISSKSAERKLLLLQAGVVEPIFALLRTVPTASNRGTAESAATLVCNLATINTGAEAMQKAGAIALLVSLLAAAPAIAAAASAALCNLSWDSEAERSVNRAEILEAGAIPPLVALLHGETAGRAAGAIQNLANDPACAAAIRLAGGVVPLVALLHTAQVTPVRRETEALTQTAKRAAGALCYIAGRDQRSRPTILAALAARPPPPPLHDDRRNLAQLLDFLQPIATERLRAVEAGDDAAALQEAIDQAAAVRVADAVLQPAHTKLAAMREAAEAARRERRTSLGLDELKTPDEFVCPITFEVMQDPVVASDGHTYERSAIEEVLALPEERRKSPLTREPLQATLFPNRALKNRIAAHEQEAEALAEKAAQKAVEVERSSVASRKRPIPAGAEVIKLEEESDEGASSSSAPAGGHKRGRRE